MNISNPKVLIFDIETAPISAYVWGLKDQNIGLSQIQQDWSVLAWSAKWLGEPASKIIYRDVRGNKDLHEDKNILIPLWELLNQADIVITQYGSGFDSPRLNARFIIHGMKPPRPYKHLDTYRIVKRVAQFTSNKLEYLTKKLCTKYKKLGHSNFPGMSLWTECLARNPLAWAEMKKYNIHDVLSTEEFYIKIRAWAPESMPKVYTVLDNSKKCSTCATIGQMNKQGYKSTKRGMYQRYQCKNCGSWSLGDKI